MGISAPRYAMDTAKSGELPSTKEKLTGRAFYESLGSPKMILAPMVDQSEFVRFSWFLAWLQLD